MSCYSRINEAPFSWSIAPPPTPAEGRKPQNIDFNIIPARQSQYMESTWIYGNLCYNLISLGKGQERHFPYVVWGFYLADEVYGDYGQDNR